MAKDPNQPIVALAYEGKGWAEHVRASAHAIKPGSDAEADRALAGGGGIIPTGAIEALCGSVSDHLLAWNDKVLDGADPPLVRLSFYADFTLLRPVLEALAWLIWCLAPEESKERVRRAIEFENVELEYGRRLATQLASAGTPERGLSDTYSRLEKVLVDAAKSAGLDPDKLLGKSRDVSAILRAVGSVVPGPTLETLRWWALASAHAHTQLVTVLFHAELSHRKHPAGPYIYAEVDTTVLAGLCAHITKTLNVAVGLLNRRGYALVPDEPHVRVLPNTTDSD
jgi:hypothetical protein